MPTKKKTPKKAPTKRRVTRPKGTPDMAAARELVLYIANTETHYRQMKAIDANLNKKFKKGIYDPEKAVKGYRYVVDAAAKSYAKEIARSPAAWSRMFTVPTRDLAARNLAHNFITYYAGWE